MDAVRGAGNDGRSLVHLWHVLCVGIMHYANLEIGDGGK